MFGIMEKIIKKVNKIDIVLQDIEYIKMALGRIENRQINNSEMYNYEYKVFSQWGEDGIIQWIVNNVNIGKKTFIEFGVQNYTESNTRFLLMNNNWSGLVIDGSEKNVNYIKNDDIYWRYNLKAECNFITAENINNIFIKNGIKGNIGLLSIDIDGNDYWVWNAINVITPDIVICEYNHRFGKNKAITIPYDAKFVREKAHYSNIYYGASIKALVLLANKKGYSLVEGSKNGNNVFFVKNNLLNENVKEKSIDDVFINAQFRESRMADGNLAFFTLEQEQELLKNLKVVNIEE
ncbi:hypothetical protein [Pectinatus frisingensis]|uniref:hypothetical protein n=1 Tax=Pectinatus frisingensis TaxID=865 RepID=UPI001E478A9B|nr:hypothetical protein [Pectinatus frisingensis]